jgi:hypothetical protein
MSIYFQTQQFSPKCGLVEAPHPPKGIFTVHTDREGCI